MATLNIGAKKPLIIPDELLNTARQSVQSGGNVDEALKTLFEGLSGKVDLGRRSSEDVNALKNLGFSRFEDYATFINSAQSLEQGNANPVLDSLRAVLQNQEQPTQYVPGSLQQGQTPQVVEGTAPAPEPNEQPNLQAQRLSQGTGQAQQTQQAPAQVAQAPALPKSTYTGPSIVDYLNSVGQDSSFASRARLAQQAGIQNYTGTASQNTQLLNSLRSQQTTQTASTIPAGGFTLDQIRQQASLTPAQNLAQEQAKQQAVTTTSPAQTALQSYGIQADDTSLYQAAQSNPVQFVTDLYNQMYRTAGLGDIKNQYETINKEYEDLQNELSDKIQDINDNPWLTEGVRQRQIRSLQARYEDRLGNLTNRLTLSQSLYESGVAEVRFVTDLAVGQYNAELSRQQDLYLKTLDNAQRQAEAEFDQAYKIAGLEIDRAQLEIDAVKAQSEGGLTTNQLLNLRNTIQDNFRQDPSVKIFQDAVLPSFQAAQNAYLQQSGTGDIVLMRMIAKMTDPTTGVREEEFRTFEGAQSTLSRYGVNLTKRWWAGDRLSQEGRDALFQIAQNIYKNREAGYVNSYQFYANQLQSSGIPGEQLAPFNVAPEVQQPLSPEDAYQAYLRTTGQSAPQQTQSNQTTSQSTPQTTTQRTQYNPLSGLTSGYQPFSLGSF